MPQMNNLEYLKAAVGDCIHDESHEVDDIIRAVRAGFGDQVAYHKRMADRAQRSLEQVNRFGPASEPVTPLKPLGSNLSDIDGWDYDGLEGTNGTPEDTISFATEGYRTENEIHTHSNNPYSRRVY